MFNIDVKLTKDDESEVLRYLQHNGKDIDENLHSQVLECMEKINAVAKPNFQRMGFGRKGKVSKRAGFLCRKQYKKTYKRLS